jgi:hypothetical protein
MWSVDDLSARCLFIYTDQQHTGECPSKYEFFWGHKVLRSGGFSDGKLGGVKTWEMLDRGIICLQAVPSVATGLYGLWAREEDRRCFKAPEDLQHIAFPKQLRGGHGIVGSMDIQLQEGQGQQFFKLTMLLLVLTPCDKSPSLSLSKNKKVRHRSWVIGRSR